MLRWPEGAQPRAADKPVPAASAGGAGSAQAPPTLPPPPAPDRPGRPPHPPPGSPGYRERSLPNGPSLNPHFHFHLCVVDGLFERLEGDPGQDPAVQTEDLRFHEATALNPQLLEGLQHTVRFRVLRQFIELSFASFDGLAGHLVGALRAVFSRAARLRRHGLALPRFSGQLSTAVESSVFFFLSPPGVKKLRCLQPSRSQPGQESWGTGPDPRHSGTWACHTGCG